MSCVVSGACVSSGRVWTNRPPRGQACELWRRWREFTRLSVGDVATHAHGAVPANEAVEGGGALLLGRGLCPEHDAGEERGALEEAGVDLALSEQPLLLGRTLGSRAA